VLRAAIAVALVTMIGAPAFAQQRSGAAADPGQIEKRIRAPEAPRGVVAPITAPAVPAAPEAAPAPAAKFVLVGVEITGSTVYQPAELSFSYEDFLGREISLNDVEKILAAITKKYQNDGYILSRAVAPAQTAQHGLLRLEIIEGFVERVEFEGAKPGGESLLQGFADKITSNRPLRLATLERYLLLMAGAPGLRVFPALKTLDESRGSYALQIRLTHSAVDGFVNFDNRGTTPVGPLQLFAGVNLNSVLGLLERTRISIFTIPNAVEELRYGQLHHDQILNAEGTQAWFDISRSIIDTGDAGQTNKNNSRGTRATLGLSHPVIRNRTTNLFLTLKLELINSDKKSGEVGGSFDDRLRVARVGGRFGFKDGLDGINWFSVEASKGFDVFDASKNGSALASRAGGRNDFFKLTFDVTRYQPLWKNFALQIAGSLQKSPNVLLSSEEFAVGGRRYGRAYDPSELSGGEGAAGSLELQYLLPVKPDFMRRIQLYGYYDIGAVWGDRVTGESLASAGGGFRLGLPWDVDADFEATMPLTRAITPGESDSGGPRFFFNVLKRF